jgi:hypothetical protein
MLAFSEHRDPAELDDRLRDAHAVTAELISEVIGETCRRFRLPDRPKRLSGSNDRFKPGPGPTQRWR